jgi:hypothetical protein
MDTNYVFWDLEPTGYWDEKWNEYQPKFAALPPYDWADTATMNIARGYIQEMLAPLHDGHLAIYWGDENDGIAPNSRPPYMPAEARVEKRYLTNPDANPQTTFSPINQTYLAAAVGTTLTWAATTTSDPITMATGEVLVAGGHIRYLYFSGFAIGANIENADVKGVMNAYFSDINTADCKGVIFDIRGNGGGANADIPLLLSPLLTSNLTFAHSRVKKSAGRLNYMPWAPYVLSANPEGGTFSIDGDATSHPLRALQAGKIPVVTLVNDNSVSCAEIMPLAVKAMPTGYLIGSKTWGGTGPHMGDESPAITHGGCFTHNKLWTRVYQTGFQLRDRDFQNYEGDGITPNEVAFSKTAFDSGTDAQFLAAKAYIESHQ